MNQLVNKDFEITYSVTFVSIVQLQNQVSGHVRHTMFTVFRYCNVFRHIILLSSGGSTNQFKTCQNIMIITIILILCNFLQPDLKCKMVDIHVVSITVLRVYRIDDYSSIKNSLM